MVFIFRDLDVRLFSDNQTDEYDEIWRRCPRRPEHVDPCVWRNYDPPKRREAFIRKNGFLNHEPVKISKLLN